jgi:hypothetical protein
MLSVSIAASLVVFCLLAIAAAGFCKKVYTVGVIALLLAVCSQFVAVDFARESAHSMVPPDAEPLATRLTPGVAYQTLCSAVHKGDQLVGVATLDANPELQMIRVTKDIQFPPYFTPNDKYHPLAIQVPTASK